MSTIGSSTAAEASVQFRVESTIHGVGKLRTVKHGCGRCQQIVFFLGVVFASTAILLYESWLTVSTYLLFAVKTDLSYLQASSTDPYVFPAITFCNNNEFFRDAFGTNPAVYLPVIYSTQPAIPFVEGMQMCSSTAAPPNLPLLEKQLLNDTGSNSSPNYLPSFASAMNLSAILFALGSGNVNRLWNHNSLNSVLSCRWQGKPFDCQETMINHFTDMGFCFTFNAASIALDAYWMAPSEVFGTNASTMSKYNFATSMPGKAAGAEFILNVHSAQYCSSGLQFTFGFAADVHAGDAMPLISNEEAIELAPGFDVDVAISMRRIQRLTENLGKCRSSWTPEYYPPGWRYTKQGCRIECATRTIIQHCNCYTQWTPSYGAVKLSKTMQNCGTQALANCQTFWQNAFDTWNSNDTFCIYECDETDYDVSVSAAYFPAPNALAQFIRDYNLTAEGASSAEVSRSLSIDDIRKDYLRVTFFMESLEYRLVVESQAMLIGDLVNGIGGALGLCLGGSVMSIGEIGVWLLDVVWALFKKKLLTGFGRTGTGDE